MTHGTTKVWREGERDHQSLSSVVPNDYNHLNVPGSVNFPLDHPRSRRPHARRRRGGPPTWVKALLAMAGVTFALGVVRLVIFALAFPPFFRGLEPRYQQRLIDMFPPFESLRATVPFEVLPTLSGASDSDAAQQLLLTQEEPGLAGSPQPGGSGLTDPGDEAQPETPPATLPDYMPSPTPTESAGGIPVGVLPTEEPTLPVYEATPAVALPTFTPEVLPTEMPLPPTVKLGNIRYEKQGWNNRPHHHDHGPQLLRLDGYQTTAANWMKPHPEDKNVSPWQVRLSTSALGSNALPLRRDSDCAKAAGSGLSGGGGGEHPAGGRGWLAITCCSSATTSTSSTS